MLMTPEQILFILVAAAALGAAISVVTTPNLIHAALWLIVALFGVAVMYAMLSAGFLAVVQVVVYIGAIAILMIFAIMLTRRVAADIGPQTNANWPWALALAVVILGGLIWMFSGWGGLATVPAPLARSFDGVNALGTALVAPNGFVLPFELASVLLLAALIGAIMIAWERK
jgi:NADH-quinone oxidoreductase subunit J